ncbi:helix-turn-helix domain-containing protein [Paenibacillus eucommiae]|uniref:AraC-like DNA-binding protein n=1 Tax=Paenibacillus eucommiae TaxID=1355755 RepID=A0ABS4IQE2_9BACL|nr:AraC family transcriptional regulator [Paenibacillus eucommiae]MBP1989126.1 AraC-like DNA-binding protein [Paenibacillus eucommiae]
MQLDIPPLPQFITIGHGMWHPGECHFHRNFQVYDMLIVVRGTLYMAEEGKEYEIGAGNMLVLEPGKSHWGYRKCEEETEIYWMHFVHTAAPTLISDKQIQWSSLMRKGTERDEAPSEQMMYLPKFVHTDLAPFIPTLRELLHVHSTFTLSNVLRLQSLQLQFFSQMQDLVMASQIPTRSFQICKLVEDYLKKNITLPFSAALMQKKLQYNIDYLARCLKIYTGMTPLQYLQALRIEEVKRLLMNNNTPIPLIAEQAGFTDYNYFIRVFRKQVGVPPGKYRREKQGFM